LTISTQWLVVPLKFWRQAGASAMGISKPVTHLQGVMTLVIFMGLT
jgi:hypothetical protein